MPDSRALSLPCSTDFFDASTWTSRAPASLSSRRADAGIAEQVEHVGVGRRARASSPIAAPCRGRSRDGGTASARRGSGRRRATAPTVAAPAGAGPSGRRLPRPSRGRRSRPGPSRRCAGAHIACGSGRTTLIRAIALELVAIAAIDQAPVGPRLGDDRGEIGHAASGELRADRRHRSAAVENRCARRPRVVDVDRAQLVEHLVEADRIRPNTSIERAIWSARPCGLSSAISRPASIWARARSSSASVRLSTASGEHVRAPAASIRPRARGRRRSSMATSPVSAKAWLQALDRISEPALLAQLLEQPRRRSAAERLDEERQRRQPRVAPPPGPEGRGTNAPVRSSRRSLRTPPVKSARPIGAPGRLCHVAEQALGESAAARRDRPCRSPTRISRDGTSSLASQSRQSSRGDRARWSRLVAEHRAAERLVGERRLEQMIVDEVVGRIDDFAELGQDHRPSRARDARRRSAARGRDRRSARRRSGTSLGKRARRGTPSGRARSRR